ncbi:hypothetical protein ACP70R_042666 [Stipagrostis hirtigluma subsp. patula]
MGLCFGKVRRHPGGTTAVLPPWSDLPPELVGLVLRRLPSYLDRLRFRAVCRQWRLAAQQQEQQPQLPPSLPWLRLHGLTFRSLPGGEVLRLTDPDLRASAACVGCVNGWLLCARYNSNHTHSHALPSQPVHQSLRRDASVPLRRRRGLHRAHPAKDDRVLAEPRRREPLRQHDRVLPARRSVVVDVPTVGSSPGVERGHRLPPWEALRPHYRRGALRPRDRRRRSSRGI